MTSEQRTLEQAIEEAGTRLLEVVQRARDEEIFDLVNAVGEEFALAETDDNPLGLWEQIWDVALGVMVEESGREFPG